MANTQYGIFNNSIPYARVGSGKKTLLYFIGGPGNGIPRGIGFSLLISGLKPLLDEYTLYAVSRKSGLSEDYTFCMMSDDYAEMIQQEFDGHVDLVVGISYGGIIAQYFAADHADCCDHIVIAMATHKAIPEGVAIDQQYAQLASQGQDRQAGVAIAKALYPSGIMHTLMTAAMWLFGPSYIGEKSSTYSQDVIIEAKVEETSTPVEVLKRIQVPVLLLDGENDAYFVKGSAEEMAGLIPNATLILYPDKGHDISGEKRFGDDIQEFVAKHPK
jgi:pimeloyl-ACP methyl ester carboxylesterase